MHQYTLQEYESNKARWPQGYLFKNVENLGIDPAKMAREEPMLFNFMCSILDSHLDAQRQHLWYNYRNAYEWAKNEGLLNPPSVREHKMKQHLDELEMKVNGPCLIPVQEIEGCITERKRRSHTSLQLDYVEFIGLLETHYSIKVRGFFAKEDNSKEMAKKLGIKMKDYQQLMLVSPAESEIAARLAVLNRVDEQFNALPYVDFWHHLLDTDFAGISNGSSATLYLEESNRHMPVYALLRKAIFKELAQLEFYQGTSPDKISCVIAW